MFNPVPPRSESASSADEARDDKNVTKRPMTLSSGLLAAGGTFQALCGLCTLLSWTREVGLSRAGYEGLPFFEVLYDGSAGQMNLAATPLALVILIAASRNPRKELVYPFVFVIICWNVGLSIWLARLWFRLDFRRDYGLTLTLMASIATAACMIGSYISWRREKTPQQ